MKKILSQTINNSQLDIRLFEEAAKDSAFLYTFIKARIEAPKTDEEEKQILASLITNIITTHADELTKKAR